MPARADDAPADFDGVVTSGLGEGARFTALDWVGAAFVHRLGFVAWPGTLNLRMSGAAWRRWRRDLPHERGLRIDPPPGFCAATCFAVTLDERVRAAAVFPDVPGYPDDKLELVAPVALREVLALHDGARVHVRVHLQPEPTTRQPAG